MNRKSKSKSNKNGGLYLFLILISPLVLYADYSFKRAKLGDYYPLALLIIILLVLFVLTFLIYRLIRNHRSNFLQCRTTLLQIIGLSPKDFELFMVQLYIDMGYKVIHTGKPNDHGIDLIVTDKSNREWIVQCKKYAPAHLVGEPEVRDLAGSLIPSRAIGAVLVTTSDFTRNAYQWSKHNPALHLYNGQKLTKVILKNRSLNTKIAV